MTRPLRQACLASLLLCAALAASAAAPAGVRAGESLAGALEALRGEGLGLVYSDALVTPELRVLQAPGEGTPEQVARRILAPHGLALKRVRTGLYAVVPDPAVRAAALSRPGGAPADVAATDRLQEVAIHASRYRVDPAAGFLPADLTREQIEALPGLDEDVLRVMRYLPGTATNGVSARANVRGGRDNELAVYFDGAPLFEPFHFKDYQGLFGVLDPGAIATLDFFSGVFPVRYGDRLSGVLDIAPRAATDADHHEIGLSMLYAHGLTVGETEWRERPARWLVSLRQSTVEFSIKAANRNSLDPHFLDALARVEYEPDARTRIAAGFLLLNDSLDAEISGDEGSTQSSYGDGTAWLRASREWRPGSTLTAVVSGTERHTDRAGEVQREGSVAGQLVDEREFRAITLRIEAEQASAADDAGGDGAAGFGWLAGVEAQVLDATYEYSAAARFDPALAAAFGRPSAFARVADLDAEGRTWAVYGSARIAPAERWRFDLGLRYDAQRHEARNPPARERFAAGQWSPRLAAQFQWDEDTLLRASVGRAFQSERPDELQVSDGEPTFHGVQRATQAVLSLERRLTPRASLRVEAYRKDVDDPAPRYENLLNPVVLLPEIEVDRLRVAPLASRMYGAEMSLRWQASRAWNGWFTYSWSEAKDDFGGLSAPRSWNQLHAAATGLAWTRGPWQLSATTTWHSGWRSTPIVAAADPTAPGGLDIELGERNSRAWAPFFSLDLRGTWRRALPVGQLRLYAELNNVTDNASPCCLAVSVLPGAVGTPRLDAEVRNWLPRYVLVGAAWELP